ncbi:MAG: GNAT family N-acetyltransferase [Pseudomonadota bacterium]
MPKCTASDFVLREARYSEAQAIAHLHATAWRETYEGIAPPMAVEKLDAAHRLIAWREALDETTSRRTTLVAHCNNEFTGFISFGPADNAVYGEGAEIKHLYVGRAWRGRGIGHRLLAHAFQQLHLAGYHDVGLAVVKENTAARSFYAALGGVEITEFEDPGPLWKSRNILVAWSLPVGSVCNAEL